MPTCHACMRRCLQTIIGVPLSRTLFFLPPAFRVPRRSLQRTYSALAVSKSRDQRDRSQQDENTPSKSNGRGSLPPARFEKVRQEWLKSRGVRPSSKVKQPNFDTEVALKKHLEYLQDPLKLSDYIKTILRRDEFETAEKVVQYASKNMQCVVSWNHLVSYQLSKGRMNAAIKTYNDMKKRAQTPDAYTYTIIFRGCAEHKDSAQALEKVLAIYHSMFADKCPVKPSTIHVNAVLKMCAKAGDLDAMFAIADHLPEKGLRAPNNLTYTTILNGLRMKLTSTRFPEMSSAQNRNEARKLILTARHIWNDIVKRWRMGDVWIDEELVCAMGRLMLSGDERDADDILSLVEQTMSIPRQFATRVSGQSETLGEAGHDSAQPAALEVPEQTQDMSSVPAGTSKDKEEDAIISFSEKIVLKGTPPKGVASYPSPGRNTLSLIMAALLKLKSHDSPKSYWTYLTSPPYSIIPDAENHTAYLRVLRVTRASKEIISILDSMPKDHRTHGVFRIGMSTCLRDKNNPHSFSNAGKVLDYMQTTLTTPDPKVLEAYLELAITAPVTPSSRGFSPVESSPSNEESLLLKRKHGSIISRALSRLQPNYANLRTTLFFGDAQMPRLDGRQLKEYTEATVRLAQRMVSAYDLLMNNGMVDRHLYVPFSQERGKLAAFITRVKHRASKQAERDQKAAGAAKLARAQDKHFRASVTEHRSIELTSRSEEPPSSTT